QREIANRVFVFAAAGPDLVVREASEAGFDSRRELAQRFHGLIKKQTFHCHGGQYKPRVPGFGQRPSPASRIALKSIRKACACIRRSMPKLPRNSSRQGRARGPSERRQQM